MSSTVNGLPRPGHARTTSSSSALLGWLGRMAILLKDAAVRWTDDACYRLGASLAYYALFSIFPLLLVSVTGLGFFLGSDASVRERVLGSVAGTTSPEFRAVLDQTLTAMQTHETARGVGAVVGIVTLFMGASGVFSELQSSFNAIWRVKPPPSGGIVATILHALRDKALSFLAVIAAGALLLASLITGTAVHALSASGERVIADARLWQGVEALASFGLTALVFATLFRFLPQTRVAWRDVVGGALFTAALFSVMKHVLAWYLSHLGSYAAYGAVGAVLGFLTWIYLASLLVFYGAELTRVYAERAGGRLARESEPAPRG